MTENLVNCLKLFGSVVKIILSNYFSFFSEERTRNIDRRYLESDEDILLNIRTPQNRRSSLLSWVMIIKFYRSSVLRHRDF